MKYIGLIIILFCSVVFGQTTSTKNLKTPNSEVEDFLVWLQDQHEDDQPYLRGFTTYAVPENLRADVALQLSFILHSCTGISGDADGGSGSFYPLALAEYTDGKLSNKIKNLRLIPNSDTIYWIDIREFNWSFESWEKITKFDGYMVEPIIQHENNGLLRLLAGNAVVRADWFVVEVSRGVNQTDRNRAENSIYRTLLYSQVKQPKTVNEFQTVWGVQDVAKSRKLGNEFGTLVTKSKNVARHNRILFGYRTELGWYYRTYDVKDQKGKKDYLERFYEFAGLPPNIFDGGEIFATNALKLQVYDLYDDKENLADFADSTIVRHLSDVLGDARVNVPHSCFDCHAVGPLPAENTIVEFLKKNGGIYYKSKEDQLRVERVYLDGKLEESISENQELYAKALFKVNGLKPEDNLKSYYRVITWYDKPLTVDQVAFECGVTKEKLIEKSKEGLQDINNKIPGRLALLLASNEEIPRDIWGSENVDGIPGIFQQTMIVINGLTKIKTQILQKYVAICDKKCNIYQGGTVVLKSIEAGTKIIEILDSDKSWSRVKLEDGTTGWLKDTDFRKIE